MGQKINRNIDRQIETPTIGERDGSQKMFKRFDKILFKEDY